MFCSLTSVVVCNTPRRAYRRLHPRRPGDEVMPPPPPNYSSTVTLYGGPVVLRPVRVTHCFASLTVLTAMASVRGLLTFLVS